MKKREKNLVVAIVLLIVLSFVYNTVLQPSINFYRHFFDDYDSKITKYKKDKELLLRYDWLKSEHQKYPSLQRTGMNEQQTVQESIEDIEIISKKSNTYILSLKPRATKQIAENYKEIAFDVIIEGDIKSVSDFMYTIETNKDLLRIKKYILSQSGSKSSLIKGIFIIRKIIST